MPDATATKTPHADANYKETVESILVAFILAFIFRAFIVEAFVIPTGSMAPTLYGAHIRYRCPDCGYTFDAGVKGTPTADPDDMDIPAIATPAVDYHCPNCGYDFSATDPQPVRFGDRILVLKYLYLFQQPRRWDVVVFKSPDEQNHHVPEDPEYGMNYIKRLIGIGPESIVILDGNVYTGPFDADSAFGPDGKLLLGSDGKPIFKIQRKPNYAQDSLWRVINNNDFIPHLGKSDPNGREHPWTQPWQEETPSSGWKLSAGATKDWPGGAPSRIFDFSNPQANGAISFNSEANPDVHALTDFLVYDESEHRSNRWVPLYVSDLKLSCNYTRRSGQGPLRLQLSKNADVFTAEFSPGAVRLLRAQRVLPDQPKVVDERELKSARIDALGGNAPVAVELINVDYRVSIRVNGKEVLATTDEEYSPYPKFAEIWKQEEEGSHQGEAVQGPFARPMVRIDAQQQDARVEHVVLSRDIYYLSVRSDQHSFWGNVRRISHLNPGEYFVMGDNSFISGDARYWDTEINLPHEGLRVESGRVPERFMLGKAFFVYWPAGYRLPSTSIHAVPDFGDMRFIR